MTLSDDGDAHPVVSDVCQHLRLTARHAGEILLDGPTLDQHAQRRAVPVPILVFSSRLALGAIPVPKRAGIPTVVTRTAAQCESESNHQSASKDTIVHKTPVV